ncbi:mitochondrial rRNA methyltransferase 2 [Brevipalpus obovatus]|uniref:mitochondrial rRNA methyltransferase 2 n=1 Tax=Brevipalpus obovatus TaxID=246614 RepID=UPI003D9F72C0
MNVVRTHIQCDLIRSISTTCCAHGKGVSSSIWINRHKNDPYVKKSRYENYRARSAYKLLEIDGKYHFLKPGIIAIDCGAAPGAWTQVMVRQCYPGGIIKPNGTFIISIDLGGIAPIEGANVLPFTDFTSPLNQAKIISLLHDRKVNVLCSDMCPNVSGFHETDHEQSLKLVISAFQFGVQTLDVGAVFLAKILYGPRIEELVDLMRKFFQAVKIIKPPSSRDDSSESFVIGLKFKGLKDSNS